MQGNSTGDASAKTQCFRCPTLFYVVSYELCSIAPLGENFVLKNMLDMIIIVGHTAGNDVYR